jgi:hypothetical protein
MSDTSTISGLLSALARPAQAGYGEARQVSARAAVSRSSDPPQLERALSRLDQVLNSDTEPNRNVPRGYYLNITV